MASQLGRRELGDCSVPWGTLQGDGRLRTTLEEKRVPARQGWAGEKGVIFSILLG